MGKKSKNKKSLDKKNVKALVKKVKKGSAKLKKNKLMGMLSSKKAETKKSNPLKDQTLSLRERMMAQLKTSRFRYLNEQMYSSTGLETKKYFEEDPDSFHAYHEGYKNQVKQWPINPLDIIIESIKKMPKDITVADFGCGEAKLADSVEQKVDSFDLVAVNEKVKACDMSQTPLLTGRTNVVVFCLSLMGTNLRDYLLEANRVLVKNGVLKIAEVESRFESVDEFMAYMKHFGFTNTWVDFTNNLFYFMDFKKIKDINRNDLKKIPELKLKACLYKKR